MPPKADNSHREAAPFLQDKNLGFPTRPRLAPDLRFFDMPDGLGVQVRGGEYNTVLRGLQVNTVWPWLAPLLDGSSTVDDLLRAKPADVPDKDVLNTIWVAFTKGLLIEGKESARAEPQMDATLRRQKLFWGRKLGLTRANGYPEQVEAKLANANVAMFGNGLLAAVTLDVLSRSGFGTIRVADWEDGGILSDSMEPARENRHHYASTSRSLDSLHQWLQELTPIPDLLITATRDVPGAVFDLINRHCLENNIRWLRGNDDLVQIEIGPFVDPFSSGCFTCMLLRQISCMDHPVEEELYQQHLAENAEEMPGGSGESVAFATAGASLLAMEAIRITTGITPPSTENVVITMTFRGSITTNRFLRVPRCPDCYRGSHNTSIDDT